MTILDDGVFMAEADVRRVERIVRNLVTNAIDHADSSGVDAASGYGREGDRSHGRATTGSACSPASRRWCSTGSGAPTRPGPARPEAPASAWRSPSRTPGCTAAGCRHGAPPGGGAQFRLTLPRRAGDPLSHSPLPLVPQDIHEGVT